MARVRAARPRKTGPAGYLFWVLSDIHADAANTTLPVRYEAIKRDFIPAMQRITDCYPEDVHGGLLLLGDLTRTSMRDDYLRFTDLVFRPFRDALGDSARVYAVPGNHDHMRSVMPSDAVRPGKNGGAPTSLHPKTLSSHYDRLSVVADESQWEARVGSRFFQFDRWAREHTSIASKWTGGPWMADVPPDGRNPGFSLRLVGLNSAVASDGSGEESGLWVHHAQLAKVLADAPSDGAVTLTLLHHAPDRDLDARDGETLALLYAQSRLVLHGHYHEFGGVPAAPGRPPMLRMPALGHPQPKEGIDPNLRDGCAVIRVLRDRVQAFFLSHRQPENFGTMAAVYDHAPDGTPMPTCELSYSPGGTIHKVGP